MSARDAGDLATAVLAIWERRRESVLGRVATLDRAAEAARAGTLTDSVRAEACAEAHKLAGSAGSFGFPSASQLALEAERILEAAETIGPAEGERLARLARGLRMELNGSPVVEVAT